MNKNLTRLATAPSKIRVGHSVIVIQTDGAKYQSAFKAKVTRITKFSVFCDSLRFNLKKLETPTPSSNGIRQYLMQRHDVTLASVILADMQKKRLRAEIEKLMSSADLETLVAVKTMMEK